MRPGSNTVTAVVLAALGLSACAAVNVGQFETGDPTDIWDASLLPVRHIDPGSLAFGSEVPDVSGFVSAIAVQGDRLYVVDTASAQVLEISLATESLRTLGRLRDGDSRGLLAADDGRVFALDPLDRSIRVFDPFFGQQQRLPLDGVVASPVDIDLIDGRDLAVVDGLDGGIVMLGSTGGLIDEQLIQRSGFPSVVSPRALAHAGGKFLVLDERADEVVGFRSARQLAEIYAGDELFGVRAMAVDSCGRFFIADDDAGTIYLGVPDMSVPGMRVAASQLAEHDVTDLWADGDFLYVATRHGGIFVYLVDPGCD